MSPAIPGRDVVPNLVTAAYHRITRNGQSVIQVLPRSVSHRVAPPLTALRCLGFLIYRSPGRLLMKVESPTRGSTHVSGSLRRREGGPRILGAFGLARFEPPRAWIEVLRAERVHPVGSSFRVFGHLGSAQSHAIISPNAFWFGFVSWP